MALKRNVYNNWTELQKSIDEGGRTDTYTRTEIDNKLAEKQHVLTAGTNIIINDNIISARTDDFTTKTYVDAADNTLQTNINNEVQVRSNADTTLQTNINNEITNRTIEDTTLQNNIDSEVTARTNADTNLDAKKQDKLSAGAGIDITDNVIKTTLIDDNNKATTTTYSSSKIQALLDALAGKATIKVVDTQPATPDANTLYYIGTASPYEIRLYADNVWYDMGTTEVDLSNYYKKTETYSQEQIDDKVTFLQTAITTEKNNRTDADTTLQTNIDNEATARTTADTNLQTQISNNDTDIETNKTNIETNKTNITTNTTNIATNTTDITSLKNDKQDKLTAGDGIDITGTTIKAKVKKLKVGPDETEETVTGDGTITMPHLYMHNFAFGQSNYMLVGVTIFTNSETALGKSGLINWLSTNGYTTLNNVYPLSTGVAGVNTYYVSGSSGGSTTTRVFINTMPSGVFANDSSLKCKSNFNGTVILDDSYYGLIKETVVKIY